MLGIRMSGFLNLLRRFRANEGGNFATLIALSLVSAVGAGGLAVDYSRATQTKADIYAAADSAALAAARTIGTTAERDKVARDVFASNLANVKNLASSSMSPENITKDGANYGYRVTANAQVKTMFGAAFGVDQFNIDVLAEAVGTISANTEIALVLDTTYSMTGWKIDTLKKASTDMVDSLAKLATKPDQLKFSIVPFSEYVNVGLGNRKKPWIDVPDDYQDPSTKVCWKERPVTGQTNCRVVNYPATPGTPSGTCYNDGVPYSCGGSSPQPAYSANVCDYTYGPEVEKCAMQQGQKHTWYGCVGSRNNPLDTQDGNYTTRIPGLMDTGCGTPMVELTPNFSTLKTTISALTPNGETYIPQGLLWGWRTLSLQAPFEAKASSTTDPVRKFIVLMTDGLNTRSASYPWHWGNDGTQANNLTKQICTNIASDKTSNITIFSVAFDVTDNTIKNILKDCAINTKGQFFDARDATQFLTAFSKITNLIAELRLSK